VKQLLIPFFSINHEAIVSFNNVTVVFYKNSNL